MRRAYMLVITRHQFVTGSRDAREADSNKLRGHDPRVGRFGGRRLQDGDRFEGELELLRCENICLFDASFWSVWYCPPYNNCGMVTKLNKMLASLAENCEFFNLGANFRLRPVIMLACKFDGHLPNSRQAWRQNWVHQHCTVARQPLVLPSHFIFPNKSADGLLRNQSDNWVE